MKIKLNSACEIQEVVVVIILFPLVLQCLYLLCPEAISAIPNFGANQLRFPSFSAPRLLSTAAKN